MVASTCVVCAASQWALSTVASTADALSIVASTSDALSNVASTRDALSVVASTFADTDGADAGGAIDFCSGKGFALADLDSDRMRPTPIFGGSSSVTFNRNGLPHCLHLGR